MTVLTALSPLDGRYHTSVTALTPCFSELALIKHRVLVETRWFLSLCGVLPNLPRLSKEGMAFLEKIIAEFSLADAEQIKKTEQVTHHDLKSVEYYLKEKFLSDSELRDKAEFIHFACTSEDINNIAYALMMREGLAILTNAYHQLFLTLTSQATCYAEIAILSRTHGQAATPTTLGKEMAIIAYRLQRQLKQLQEQPLLAKLNGAVGNFNAHLVAYPEVDWLTHSQQFIQSLGLTPNLYTTQIESHDYLAECFDTLSRANTILIDACRNIWGYISFGYFTQKTGAQEIGSSTMPHKINPIDFENAEGNFGLANALYQHFSEKLPISRFQRDLSDSTVLRNIGVAMGYTLLAIHSLQKGLNKLEINHKKISKDLAEHWEILAEAIQTVMRRYQLEAPYEQLKALTRGNPITKEVLHQFIRELSLPAPIKEELLALTPETYLGLASHLARTLNDKI